MWDKEFTIKSWALKWLEGSLVSYAKGSTHLNVVIGRIEKCIKSYGVNTDEIKAIIEVIIQNPAYLPTLSTTDKMTRLKPVKDIIKKMEHGR